MTPDDLATIRKRLGMTQAQLAEAIGLSGGERISEYETGRRAISKRSAALIQGLLVRYPVRTDGEGSAE
jgi:transcriptional regulator with XRE-family HTH domain